MWYMVLIVEYVVVVDEEGRLVIPAEIVKRSGLKGGSGVGEAWW